MNYQREFDRLFILLKRDQITELEYKERIEELAGGVEREFGWRKDRRTLGEFALDIYRKTRRERMLMEKCWPYIGKPGEAFIDHGLDNDGRLILEAEGRRWKADFKVLSKPDYYVEMKFAPADKFLTYKLCDVNNYMDTPDTKMLTVVKDEFFILSDLEAMRRILQYGEYDVHQGFGGKPTVRIYNSQFDKIGTTYSFEEHSHV